jgi:transcriptional regulator with GAF, ATPase, and Fis domain
MSGGTGTMDHLGARLSGQAAPGLVLLCAKDVERMPRVVPIRGESLTLGREPPEGGTCIPQTAVSRVHARIVRKGPGWQLEDLQSRNGTYLDGARIDRADLEDRGLVRIGDTLFEFVADGIDDYIPYSTELGRRATRVPELIGGLSIDRVAAQVETAAPTGLSMLVCGETGTGKELVARALHRLSGRPGPLSSINCAAVPTHLFESELFGYRKAAFTGADRDKPGILQAAGGGTVHLDEIGEMPLEAQAKLLRVLDSQEVRPVGAVRGERVDLRFVCATHRDLPALVAAGRFRADLFARISAMTIALPPLRIRREDIDLLVRHFLRDAGRANVQATFGFMLAMCDYDWPRNVRECAAVVRRAATLADGPVLDVVHLPPELQASVASYGSRVTRSAPRDAANGRVPGADELRRLLVTHAGNIAAVARELGKDRAQVDRLIRRHAISPDDFRGRRT